MMQTTGTFVDEGEAEWRGDGEEMERRERGGGDAVYMEDSARVGLAPNNKG